MSLIVYGMTYTAAKRLATKKPKKTTTLIDGVLVTQDDIAGTAQEIFVNRNSVALSGEFSSPELCREFIELIRKQEPNHKNLEIKIKTSFMCEKTKKMKTKTEKYRITN